MYSRRVSLLFVIAFFCAGLFSSTLFIPRALAATNPFTITAQTATATFPKGIDFQVTVTDTASAISQATLVLSYNFPRDIELQRAVNVTTPQQTLTLRWHEDTTGDNFVEPGTTLSYKWQFHDTVGNDNAQTQRSFAVIDNRFNWQNLTQGQVEVHWYGQSTDFGQTMLSQAVDNVKRISAKLGATLHHTIDLWVYQTSSDFHGSLPPDVHEWVGGIAFPSLNEASIVVDSPNAETLIRDMPHELSHLIFHQLTEQGILAPLWFDEGMAVYNQTYHEPDMTLQLKKSLLNHSLLRLSEIAYTFPANSDSAYLAYAQSWNLVGYMYATFGQAKMTNLISRMGGRQGEFNDDLKQALGEDQIHLENQWRLQLNQSSVLTPSDGTQTSPAQTTSPPSTQPDYYTPLLAVVGLLLIILPLAGVSGLFAYQRRKRQRELALQEAERVMALTFPPYGFRPAQPYPSRQMQQPQRPALPFESYRTLPPVSNVDATRPYTDPRYYHPRQEQFPQPPGQEYTSQPPPRQAPQE